MNSDDTEKMLAEIIAKTANEFPNSRAARLKNKEIAALALFRKNTPATADAVEAALVEHEKTFPNAMRTVDEQKALHAANAKAGKHPDPKIVATWSANEKLRYAATGEIPARAPKQPEWLSKMTPQQKIAWANEKQFREAEKKKSSGE